MTKYKCSKCNLSVIMSNGVSITACKCNAPIVAEISATAKGQGTVKGR